MKRTDLKVQSQSQAKKSIKRQLFTRNDQSTNLTLTQIQQKVAIKGILCWLQQNLQQMSSIGKNLIVRYNWKTGEYKCQANKNTVRLDYQGKTQGSQIFSRFYIQQDQVKGKTNLAQIYISDQVDKLIQKKQENEFLSVWQKAQIKFGTKEKDQSFEYKDKNFSECKYRQVLKQNLNFSTKIKIQVLKSLKEFSQYVDFSIVQKSNFSPALRISIQ